MLLLLLLLLLFPVPAVRMLRVAPNRRAGEGDEHLAPIGGVSLLKTVHMLLLGVWPLHPSTPPIRFTP